VLGARPRQSERAKESGMEVRVGGHQGHVGMRVAMPLVSDHDGELQSIGTCFLVAPGLATTAAHVSDHWRTYREHRDGYKPKVNTFAAAAFYMHDGIAYRWDVDAIYASHVADIAFLRFKRPEWWGIGSGQIIQQPARLSFNPPSPGEIVRPFGFTDSSINDGTLIVTACETDGKVLGVEFEFDATGFRPRSYIEIAGHIAGGMSGGPCFDVHGNVLGVNVKSWELLEGDPTATVALLWQAMSVEIDLFQSGSFPVGELFTKGQLHSIGYRRLHFPGAGKTIFAKVDPDSLIAGQPHASSQQVEGAIDFALANARHALLSLKQQMHDATSGDKPLIPNDLHSALRSFFWETDAAARTALGLLGQSVGAEDRNAAWNVVVEAARGRHEEPEAREHLAELDTAWNGIELFEVRTYADWCRTGPMHVLTMGQLDGGRLTVAALEPCRVGAPQVVLADGLDRHLAACDDFAGRIVYMARKWRSERSEPVKNE
jgi:Trypsin-like peptidase domain